MQKLFAALLAACTLTLGLLAASPPAEACSPASATLEALYPPTSTTIPPNAVFVVDVSGAGATGAELTLEDKSGESFDVKPLDSSQSGIFGSVYLYTPKSPLPEGDYTLDAELIANSAGPDPMGPTSDSAEYTVSTDAAGGMPPKPTDLELSTAEVVGFGDSCSSGSIQTRLRFSYPQGNSADLGYFKVTIKESKDASAEKVVRIFPADELENGKVTLEKTLDFEATCASVDAFSTDGMTQTSVSTCQREVCAQSVDDSPYDDGFWADRVRCGEPQDDGSACSTTGDRRPLGPLTAGLLLMGLAAIRSRS